MAAATTKTTIDRMAAPDGSTVNLVGQVLRPIILNVVVDVPELEQLPMPFGLIGTCAHCAEQLGADGREARSVKRSIT